MTDSSAVVIGGGPAGLACAVELRRRGVSDVLVLDREPNAGGIPRHCAHQGFGLRDLRRLLSGPAYARRYVDLAGEAGVRVLAEAIVTGWSGDDELELTTPQGRETVRASAIVLATGCRERPRPARLVPGSRPEGVMTTGMLQQLAERRSPRIGKRALIVGAEHVSFSALLTLAHAGAAVVGMITDLPRHQSLVVARAGAALRYRAPLWTRTRLTEIRGRPRVEEVELLDLDSGATRRVACDAVVFTGDWIPDNELAVMAGLELDPGTRGPRVDTGLRTSRPEVFGAGNLLQGAEPADIAALSGRHAAASAWRWLASGEAWPESWIPVVCRAPLKWISPNAMSRALDAPPRGTFLLRSTTFVRRPTLEIRQEDRVLWRGKCRRLVPGRSSLVPCRWRESVDFSGAPIEIGVLNRH